MFVPYNPNPCEIRVGDCTVRAISNVCNQDWDTTYWGLAIQGYMMCDMPSSNAVWGEYLKKKGFKRHIIPMHYDCPDCYTVRDFCEEHPYGTYLLALNSHVVAVRDGDYFDIWDSGNEIPQYYWERKET